MKIRQVHGPFRAGEEILRIPAEVNTTYVQIGVLIPEAYPIQIRKNLKPDISINGIDFCIHGYWMVEFADIRIPSFTIVARRNLPEECIIDVMSDIRRE